jgi:single-strand DNA-binding protein
MVNRVILIGNLGADPEIRSFENGAKVARFSVATSENYKNREGEWQERTEWHDVVAWRQLADRAEQTLRKGMQVYVEGKLTHRSWEDSNGNKRRTTEVDSNYFRIVNRRDNPSPGYESSPSYQGSSTVSSSESKGSSDFPQPDSDQDDLPF